MKTKNALVLSMLAVLVLGAGAVAIADAGDEVKLTGYITDEWCGANNAGPDGADCARECAKKGSKMAIFSDGKLYILSDKEQALEHLGHKVVIKGTLAEDNVVKVSSIEKMEEGA